MQIQRHLALGALTLCLATLAAAALRPALTAQLDHEPTKQHRMLVEGVGEWEGTLTSFFPGAPSEPAQAHETVVAIGGFWTQAHFRCDFMGAPYEGTGCVGYDSARNKYVGTWIDSMSDHLAVMEGERNPETGALEMHWQSPGEDGELVKHSSSTVFDGKDGYTSTFHLGEGDAAVKSMVIEMKRKPQ